ncbi:helix-turn-helix domain-containing protein [Mesorhizobium sp. DCY119]|nr:helix-turn-helix domain-containing protein [Mesorhizobium sp. DCY119]
MDGPRYSILPADAVFDSRLSRLGLHVLAALGAHSDNNGWCIVRQKTLAEKIGGSRENVARAINELVGLGYVRKRDRFGKNGARLASLYQVAMDREPTEVELDDAITAEECGQGAGISAGVCDVGVTGGCDVGITGGVTPASHHTTYNDPLLERPKSPNGDKRAGARKPSRFSRGRGKEQPLTRVDNPMIAALDEFFSS